MLQEADKLVHGDRQKDYGHPSIDWTRTAKFWSIILGIEITPQQAVLCMIAMKLSRECGGHKYDNLLDIAGYAEVYLMMEGVLCKKQNA